MSDSFEFDELHRFLNERKLGFIEEIRFVDSAEQIVEVVVPEDRVAVRARPGKSTSRRQMRMLEPSIRRQFGFVVQWVIEPSGDTSILQAAILQMLQVQHPEFFDSVYVSYPERSPIEVWIGRTQDSGECPELAVVAQKVVALLVLLGYEDAVVAYADLPELPSTPMILRCLKVHAPIAIERLREHLNATGPTLPIGRWLVNRLDSLRKAGLVSFDRQGTYALTESGLSKVPHGRFRSSSDVERALALGWRKW